MKKKKLKTLHLKKSVVSRLNPEAAGQIYGGGTRLACAETQGQTNCNSVLACQYTNPCQSFPDPCITTTMDQNCQS